MPLWRNVRRVNLVKVFVAGVLDPAMLAYTQEMRGQMQDSHSRQLSLRKPETSAQYTCHPKSAPLSRTTLDSLSSALSYYCLLPLPHKSP